jgi:DnaJ-class molecular chaperone
VQYASLGDAQRAILELNNTMVKDRLIFVREDREGGGGGFGGGGFGGGFGGGGFGGGGFVGGFGGGFGGGGFAARGGAASVYVGNLSWDAQWQDLKDHMRGPNQDLNVLHADIMLDPTGLVCLHLVLYT